MTVFPNSIIFVSAFKNIGRDNWHFLSRTVEEYCLLFYDLASIIQYKLVVYVEDDIYDKLKSEIKIEHSKFSCTILVFTKQGNGSKRITEFHTKV